MPPKPHTPPAGVKILKILMKLHFVFHNQGVKLSAEMFLDGSFGASLGGDELVPQ